MVLQSVKAAYAERIRFLNVGESPIEGITSVLTPDHTVGHVAFVLTRRAQKFMVTGDTFTSRTTLIQHPEWIFIGDANTSRAVQTRYELLNKLTHVDMRILSYHEQFPGIGHVVRDAHGFDFSTLESLD